MNRILSLFLISLFLISCSKAEKKEVQKKVEEKIITEFGYTLNNYNVKKSKVKNGDSFGSILERNNLYYPQIYNIVQKVKKVYDIRKINIGKPLYYSFFKRFFKHASRYLFISLIKSIM
jgi:hypothetical protein